MWGIGSGVSFRSTESWPNSWTAWCSGSTTTSTRRTASPASSRTAKRFTASFTRCAKTSSTSSRSDIGRFSARNSDCSGLSGSTWSESSRAGWIRSATRRRLSWNFSPRWLSKTLGFSASLFPSEFSVGMRPFLLWILGNSTCCFVTLWLNGTIAWPSCPGRRTKPWKSKRLIRSIHSSPSSRMSSKGSWLISLLHHFLHSQRAFNFWNFFVLSSLFNQSINQWRLNRVFRTRIWSGVFFYSTGVYFSFYAGL